MLRKVMHGLHNYTQWITSVDKKVIHRWIKLSTRGQSYPPVDKKVIHQSYPHVESGTKSDITPILASAGASVCSAHAQARTRKQAASCELSCDELSCELRRLGEGGGLTLRRGRKISYKTGWQVADTGYETSNADDAAKKIVEMGGNCVVGYSNGIYYIDHSFWVKTKRDALRIGREHKQISILKWSNMSLVYC